MMAQTPESSPKGYHFTYIWGCRGKGSGLGFRGVYRWLLVSHHGASWAGWNFSGVLFRRVRKELSRDDINNKEPINNYVSEIRVVV